MINQRDFSALAAIAVVLTLTANAQAQRLPPDVTISNPQVYDVTIRTKFVFPQDQRKLSGLGVWHALPTSRPWDGLGRTLGASTISFVPPSVYPVKLKPLDTKRVPTLPGSVMGRRFSS